MFPGTIRSLDIAKFLDVDDNTLCIIFGQVIAKNICESPSAMMLPATCSLFGTRHWAPDEFGRPDPINGFGDFVDALAAAAQHFAPAEIHLTTSVALQSGEWSLSVEMTDGAQDVRTDTWMLGTEREADERGKAIQRATIISLLTLASAPATPRTPADIPTLVETELNGLRRIAAGQASPL